MAMLALASRPASAQTPTDELAFRFASWTAVTGLEQAVGDTLLTLLPGAVRDRSGSVVLTLGRGEPKRMIACPLDEVGYVVGQVRDDGYLTLRRVGASRSSLFDQQLEGHRVTLFGRKGPVPGVVAVRSTHLGRGRAALPEEPFTVDNAYADVGAASRDQVLALGVDVLAPMALTKRPHRYGTDLLAAPFAGRRAACAALVSSTRGNPRVSGTVVVAFVVEYNYGALSSRGIQAVANRLGPFSDVVVLDARAAPLGALATAPDTSAAARRPPLDAVSHLRLAIRYPDTAAETVSLADVERMRVAIVRWMGGGR
jgi:putative aminopeptidase